MNHERLIIRADLAKALGGISSQTVRRYIKDGKIPPPDKVISTHAQYWRASTLQAAGIPVDDQAKEPADACASSQSAQS